MIAGMRHKQPSSSAICKICFVSEWIRGYAARHLKHPTLPTRDLEPPKPTTRDRTTIFVAVVGVKSA